MYKFLIMKKIKCLLFTCLALSMVLLASVEATAQIKAKKDHPTHKQSFKTLELKQDAPQRVTPKLKNASNSQQLAAAKAKLQQRAANRGEKRTRPNARVTADNVPAKVKAKRNVSTAEGKLKVKSIPANAQLKVIPRNQAEAKQNRQARLTELRKKLRKQ